MTRDHSSKGNLSQQSPTPRTSAVGAGSGRAAFSTKGGRFTPGWEEVRRMFPQQETDLRFQLGNPSPSQGTSSQMTASPGSSSRVTSSGGPAHGAAAEQRHAEPLRREQRELADALGAADSDPSIPPWVLEYARRTDALRSGAAPRTHRATDTRTLSEDPLSIGAGGADSESESHSVESSTASQGSAAARTATVTKSGAQAASIVLTADHEVEEASLTPPYQPVLEQTVLEWPDGPVQSWTVASRIDEVARDDSEYFERLAAEYDQNREKMGRAAASSAGATSESIEMSAPKTAAATAPKSTIPETIRLTSPVGADDRSGADAPLSGSAVSVASGSAVSVSNSAISAGAGSAAAAESGAQEGVPTLTSISALPEDGSPSPYGVELLSSLERLVRLVANVTEAYSAAIFLVEPTAQGTAALSAAGASGVSAPPQPAATDSQSKVGQIAAPVNPTKGLLPTKVLKLVAAQTLSRDIVQGARIGFGCGLVGWTAENGVRISVCPFDHDSTTLLYYTRDQALKSFIAVPIIGADGAVLGVISCDSKKSYAFAKITEKILLDCAAQAAVLVSLHLRLGKKSNPTEVNEDGLTQLIERLRAQSSERALLSAAAELPMDVVERDALVIITTGDGLAARGAFHSPSNQGTVGHRLLELVTRHKKVICGERSVQAQGADDSAHRSFLSIPFHVLRQEAGSLNLLSRPFEPFSATEIAALERLAAVIGKELELFRLREKALSAPEEAGLLSFRRFQIRAAASLEEAKRSRIGVSLVRFALTNIPEIENRYGVEAATDVLLRAMRLVEQSKRSGSPACYLYGTHLAILTETAEAERLRSRVTRLIERMELDSAPGNQVGEPIGALLARGLVVTVAHAPRDGETVEQLCAATRRQYEADSRHAGAVIPASGNLDAAGGGQPSGTGEAKGKARRTLESFARAGNW